MIKFFGRGKLKILERKILEDIILRFNSKAEKLRDVNPRLGCRFLYQVNKAYSRLGYQKEIDIEICRVFNRYLDYIFEK